MNDPNMDVNIHVYDNTHVSGGVLLVGDDSEKRIVRTLDVGTSGVTIFFNSDEQVEKLELAIKKMKEDYNTAKEENNG